MNLQRVFCQNAACRDKYKKGAGNIVAHSQKRERCKCTSCGKTFSYRRGTMFYGLRTDPEIVMWAVGWVAWGCPVAAMVAVFEVDERTVADWLHRAGVYAEAFHHQHVQAIDLQQVQVDEIRLKMQRQVLWIAMALSVGSRLWLGAVCRVSRDKQLARQIMTCIYNWAKKVPLVIAFDAWNAYPTAAAFIFREPQWTGKVGGARKQPWTQLALVQLVKQDAMTRWILSGSYQTIRSLLDLTQGVGTTINTAYIERLNATFRAHLACFARRTRCPARHLQTVGERVFLVGCLYNFCCLHASLDELTPAWHAGLTDQRWSLEEFLWSHLLPHWASTA